MMIGPESLDLSTYLNEKLKKKFERSDEHLLSCIEIWLHPGPKLPPSATLERFSVLIVRLPTLHKVVHRGSPQIKAMRLEVRIECRRWHKSVFLVVLALWSMLKTSPGQ